MSGALRTVGIFFGIALAAALALFGYKQYGTWKAGQFVKWRADSTRVADSARVATIRAMVADTVYRTTKQGYIVYRDRLLQSPTATAKDSATFGRCDAIVSSCDERHRLDSLVIVAKDRQIAVANAKPSDMPKRWSIYGEALYGVTAAGPDSVLGAAPVFRGGSEFRLFGPITAKAEGELSMPPAGRSKPMGRAFVGIRYVF